MFMQNRVDVFVSMFFIDVFGDAVQTCFFFFWFLLFN